VPAILAVLLLVTRANAGQRPDHRSSELGTYQDLQIPHGNAVTFDTFGVDVQIHNRPDTTWSFVSPKTLPFGGPADDGPAGFHFAGHPDESLGGSKVIGSVIERCRPNPDAISWLRVKGVSSASHGIFQQDTCVQRLNTVGRKASSNPGAFLREVAECGIALITSSTRSRTDPLSSSRALQVAWQINPYRVTFI
jgi:hypothetical protein